MKKENDYLRLYARELVSRREKIQRSVSLVRLFRFLGMPELEQRYFYRASLDLMIIDVIKKDLCLTPEESDKLDSLLKLRH